MILCFTQRIITYSKTIYNPHGEEIFPVTDEERGLDPYYDPENTERFRGKGKSEFTRVSLFGCTGKNTYDITILPMIEGKEKESRGYLDVFKEDRQNRNEIYPNSLEVHIERDIFNDLKELYLLKIGLKNENFAGCEKKVDLIRSLIQEIINKK